MYPRPIQQLITAFGRLPSVGERTAERYVFYLLKSGKKDVAELALSLKNLITEVKSCEICWNFTDQIPCRICSDKKRDHSTICVVAEPQDIPAIEKTGEYQGVYHVLRGVIKADEENLNELKIEELITRLKDQNIKEIILALNPDLNGETTMMYLSKRIKKEIQKFTPLNSHHGRADSRTGFNKVKISCLARGLPMGGDLQYADEITLENALKNRTTNT